MKMTGAGIEPAARALKVRCSTTELPGRAASDRVYHGHFALDAVLLGSVVATHQGTHGEKGQDDDASYVPRGRHAEEIAHRVERPVTPGAHSRLARADARFWIGRPRTGGR